MNAWHTRCRTGLGVLVILAVAACSSDPRTKPAANGMVPFAALKNSVDADAALGAPRFAAGIRQPEQGVIETENSFGASATYVFDAGSGMLTGIWTDPDLSGSGTNPPIAQKHQAKLTDAEQNAFIKLANRAWAPRHATVRTAAMQDTSSTIWLLDHTEYKAIDGNGAGLPIAAALLSLAHTHGVVRDDHER